jgi:hypothetical protein
MGRHYSGQGRDCNGDASLNFESGSSHDFTKLSQGNPARDFQQQQHETKVICLTCSVPIHLSLKRRFD